MNKAATAPNGGFSTEVYPLDDCTFGTSVGASVEKFCGMVSGRLIAQTIEGAVKHKNAARR